MAVVTSVSAQDLTPPVVGKPLANLTVPAGTAGSIVSLKKTFRLDGVTGQIVRMATVLGNIDVELLSDAAPDNVANFLSYVNDGSYNGSFFHRSVPGFIIQGGGYHVEAATGSFEHIAVKPKVHGEPSLSNTRGTLTLALSNGPDSGSSEWFFNLVDNNGTGATPNLDDASDGGPFTVFARVIEGDLTTVDAIAAVNIPPAIFAEPFDELPLLAYDADKGVEKKDLIYLNDAVVVPLVPLHEGDDAVLALKVKNNNPALLTATITGRKLKLFYNAGQTGTAKLKVFATDSAGTRVKSKLTVTVQ